MVIKVLNLGKLLNKIKNIENIDITPVIKDGTEKVKRYARDIAPKDTGYLYKHIFSEVMQRKGANGSPWAVGRVYSVAEYSIYQEFGYTIERKDGGETSVRPQPFMRPALQVYSPEIKRNLIRFLKVKLKEQASK